MSLLAFSEGGCLRPFLVYKPPPDFFGHVQLEFVLFRAEACLLFWAKSVESCTVGLGLSNSEGKVLGLVGLIGLVGLVVLRPSQSPIP